MDVMTHLRKGRALSWHAKAITTARRADLETNPASVIQLPTETKEREPADRVPRDRGRSA